ncbi:MAG: Golgi apyrase [Chrysothrix sp. TS-e1954]|nr:MAG: Golgi apyrase [Chrysothrix sp. TS-e1954]
MGKWSYGIVLDAGSSGTRLHVYKWLKSANALEKATDSQLQRLPQVATKKTWTKKTKPGISEFGDTPELIGDEYLGDLYKHALGIIPKDEVENTPIFLLATAGMRMLTSTQRTAILGRVCSYTRRTTGFQLPDCDLHIQVIPGETEGLYGWIAANYLLGGFDEPESHNHGKGHHTYGFLDMGGASAQIAFAPNATVADEHADDLKLLRLRSVNGEAQEYRVFVTTWLEYGAREARRRYLEALAEETDLKKIDELPDPCLPVGLKVNKTIKSIDTHLLGTGKFQECESRTLQILDKDAECSDPPCPFHGTHVPPIDFDVNHFVGVSEYWHTTHEIFEFGHTDKAYDYATYQQRVLDFCSMQWSAIEDGLEKHKWGKKVDAETAEDVCFKASWLINMLHEGIGIPRVGLETDGDSKNGNTTQHVIDKAKQEGYLAPFQAINKIDHTEVSWTLGKMILYASSQVPPKTGDTLAVGFGSNIPGDSLPDDFQSPGGLAPPEHADTPIDTSPKAPTTNDPLPNKPTDTSTSLLNSTASLPRRTPGLLLILLILLLISILLCGRDRRASTVARIRTFFTPRRQRNRFLHSPQTSTSSSRSRARGFASKLPSLASFTTSTRGRGPKYERILEEGSYADDMPAPGDFELAALSDSSTASAESAGERSSAGSSSSGSVRAREKARALPRSGLGPGERLESRERESGGESTGHRSRQGSPLRRSPGFPPGYKRSVD